MMLLTGKLEPNSLVTFIKAEENFRIDRNKSTEDPEPMLLFIGSFGTNGGEPRHSITVLV